MTLTAAPPGRASTAAATGGRGAYGLRLLGVDAARSLLVPAAADWPTLELSSELGDDCPPQEWVRAERALLRIQPGGRTDVDWLRRRAVFTMPRRPSAAEIVHPYLAPVAALAARWLGRETFHAGAVLVDGGAWAVMGGNEAGKSSLLACLALAGQAILADDVLVLDGNGDALAGPRSIDLRDEAARRLGVGEPMGKVGTRERFRLVVGEVPSAVPLRGFVRLAWDRQPAVAPVPAALRLAELAAQRAVRIAPDDPRLLLELSALPMVELRRPCDWDQAGSAAERLVDALAG